MFWGMIYLVVCKALNLHLEIFICASKVVLSFWKFNASSNKVQVKRNLHKSSPTCWTFCKKTITWVATMILSYSQKIELKGRMISLKLLWKSWVSCKSYISQAVNLIKARTGAMSETFCSLKNKFYICQLCVVQFPLFYPFIVGLFQRFRLCFGS